MGQSKPPLFLKIYLSESFQDKMNKKVISIFGLAMAVVYTLLGLYLLIQQEVLNFSKLQRIGLGIILIMYGLFRFYKVKKKYEETDENEIEE